MAASTYNLPLVALTRRNLRAIFSTPSLLLPPLLAPLVFFVAFGTGLNSVELIPGFDYAGDYKTFQFVFALYASGVFTGTVGGIAAVQDIDGGITNRFMLALRDRRPILLAYLITSVVRSGITVTFLFLIGILVGVQFEGNALQIAGVILLTVLMCVIASLWSLGLAFRIRSVSSVPLMQVPLILGLYLGPTFVPLALLQGWIRGVAAINPITRFFEGGRALLVGESESVAAAFIAAAIVVPLAIVWALRGLRRAELSR